MDEVKSGHAGSPGGRGTGAPGRGEGRPRAGRGGETEQNRTHKTPQQNPSCRRGKLAAEGFVPGVLLGQLPRAGGPRRSGVRGGQGERRKSRPVRLVYLSLSSVAVAWARGSGSQLFSSVNLGSWSSVATCGCVMGTPGGQRPFL